MLHYWYMWSRNHVCNICFARLGSVRSGVSVGANGDPMAGTPDSDTTGRAEPPDGCTCETAAMARCIRSLCLEYHHWLKVLLMAFLRLVFVGWVPRLPQRPTCESCRFWIWKTSRMKKSREPNSGSSQSIQECHAGWILPWTSEAFSRTLSWQHAGLIWFCTQLHWHFARNWVAELWVVYMLRSWWLVRSVCYLQSWSMARPEVCNALWDGPSSRNVGDVGASGEELVMYDHWRIGSVSEKGFLGWCW